jgi:hypothetical protein
VLDPVACEVERVHRHGDAALLGHQTGLTLDRWSRLRAGRP